MIPCIRSPHAGARASIVVTESVARRHFDGDPIGRRPGRFCPQPFALAIAGVTSTLLPLWRANRIDPAVTLREE